MTDPKNLHYDPSVISEEEFRKQQRRLDALIRRKNAIAIPAAEAMSKLPWSSEQAREQVKELRRDRLAAEARRWDRERGNKA